VNKNLSRFAIFSRPYWRSRYWYSVARLSSVCDVMYCG